MSREVIGVALLFFIAIGFAYCSCTNPPATDPAVACVESVARMTARPADLVHCLPFVRTSTCRCR